MRSILKKLWRSRQRAIAESTRAEINEILFGKCCPICSQSLSKHVFGYFACTRTKDRDEATMRELLRSGSLDSLPQEGANDPDSDVVSYLLLKCPNRREYAVFEHFSGAGVISPEAASVVPDIPQTRAEQFIKYTSDWIEL